MLNISNNLYLRDVNNSIIYSYKFTISNWLLVRLGLGWEMFRTNFLIQSLSVNLNISCGGQVKIMTLFNVCNNKIGIVYKITNLI